MVVTWMVSTAQNCAHKDQGMHWRRDSARDYEDWRTLTRTHGYTRNRASDELAFSLAINLTSDPITPRVTPLIIFPFAISPRLSITIHRTYVRTVSRNDVCYIDVKRVAGRVVNRQLKGPARKKKEQRTSPWSLFPLLVVAVSKGSIDPSRVDPPLPRSIEKKAETQRIEGKKRDDGKKCSVGARKKVSTRRGAAESAQDGFPRSSCGP